MEVGYIYMELYTRLIVKKQGFSRKGGDIWVSYGWGHTVPLKGQYVRACSLKYHKSKRKQFLLVPAILRDFGLYLGLFHHPLGT